MYVILSTTTKTLWENDIPNIVTEKIISEFKNCLKDFSQIERHDVTLISIFQSFYGNKLQDCAYATILHLPVFLKYFYDVIQIPCYDSINYPEQISVRTSECINHFQNDPDFFQIHNSIKINTRSIQYCKDYDTFHAFIWKQ